ncbi:MAG: hypothetical protein LUO89_11325 [Methanothrix sp.]|nr:hypothetical protein [Methanothrix sp.]
MICPNCHNGKFPGMEIRHQDIHILVCTRCGWRGEPQAGYEEALFGEWKALDAETIDEAAGIPYWDARWGTGQPHQEATTFESDWRKWVAADWGPSQPPPRNPYVQYQAPHYASQDVRKTPDGYHFAFDWSDEEKELLKMLSQEVKDELKRRFGIDL